MNPGAFQPDYAVPPGETLKEWMVENNVTVLDMCDEMVSMPTFVNALLAGKANLTQADADVLERVTGITRTFWIARERDYRARLKAAIERMESQ